MSREQQREIQALIKRLERLGWTVHRTAAGHFKARSPKPDVPIVIIPQSPSDYFAIKNLKALLKRHGVSV
jgi:predicted RNA binding protein YcfA (HicA-like mRNA interferase family)